MNKLDCYFLKKTFDIARKGEGIVSPNPLVGACVVKEGVLVSEGYHRGPGTPHAEVVAITEAGQEARGATLYVSLEPCSHHGKTPPCTELIVSKGIKKVVAPIKDPNPRVNGKGFSFLKREGVKVVTGILKEEAEELNSFYLKYMRTRTPYVILKAGVTLDGRIGDPERKIFKITSDDSFREVHRQRTRVDALLVGVGTVLIDNPKLNVRLVETRNQPYKIIIDPNLRCPVNAKIFEGSGRVIIVTSDERAREKYPDALVWLFSKKNGLLDVKEILKKAGKEGITSVMIEGGSETFTQFIKAKVVDKYFLFFSPSFIGKGVPLINSPLKRVFLDARVKKMGKDFLVEAGNVYRDN